MTWRLRLHLSIRINVAFLPNGLLLQRYRFSPSDGVHV